MSCKIKFLTMLVLMVYVATATTCSSPAHPEASPLLSPQINEQELNAGLEEYSLRGTLYSPSMSEPIRKTSLYLVPASKDSPQPPLILVGPRPGDIQTFTDEEGHFVLKNVPPGKYYLAVWAPYNWVLAVNSETDLSPLLIVLEPDQRKNLGIIYVPWP